MSLSKNLVQELAVLNAVRKDLKSAEVVSTSTNGSSNTASILLRLT
jgi:hypothetical protein